MSQSADTQLLSPAQAADAREVVRVTERTLFLSELLHEAKEEQFRTVASVLETEGHENVMWVAALSNSNRSKWVKHVQAETIERLEQIRQAKAAKPRRQVAA